MGDKPTLYDLVQAKAETYKDSVALVYDDESSQAFLSYGELWLRAHQITESLKPLGVQHGVIAVCVPPSPDAVATLLGILGIPAAFFPLCPEAPEFITASLRQLGCQYIILDVMYLELLEAVLFPLSGKICSSPGLSSRGLLLVELLAVAPVSEEQRGTSLAYCLATSGTTGTPKLIRVPHACIVPNVLHLRDTFELSSDDMVFHASPLTFDPSMVEIFMTLASGASLLVVPEEVKRSPRRLLNVLHLRHPVSVLQATPTLLARFPAGSLCQSLLGPNTKLRILALGGELFPLPSVLQQWCAPDNGTQLFNLYGITEVSCWASCYEVPRDYWSERDTAAKNGLETTEGLLEEEEGEGSCPIGLPLPATSLRVLDDLGLPVTQGLGQLWIGSKERVCLVGEETCAGTGTGEMKWRSTGDIVAVLEKGEMVVVGRQDDQIKRNGKKVSATALEKVAMSVEGTEAARVLWQAGRLAVFVATSSEDLVAMEMAVTQRIAARLPSHYIPDIVKAERELPSTSHGPGSAATLVLMLADEMRCLCAGKLDKHQLLEMLRPRMSLDLAQDRETLQAWAADLWKRHLSGVVGELSGGETFLQLGGSSLQAVQLTTTVEAALGVPLPQLLDTVLNGSLAHFMAELCHAVDAKHSSSPSPAVHDGVFMSRNPPNMGESTVGMPTASGDVDKVVKNITVDDRDKMKALQEGTVNSSKRNNVLVSVKSSHSSDVCFLDLPSPDPSRSVADVDLESEGSSPHREETPQLASTEDEEMNMVISKDTFSSRMETKSSDLACVRVRNEESSQSQVHRSLFGLEADSPDKKLTFLPKRMSLGLDAAEDRDDLHLVRKKIRVDENVASSADDVDASGRTCRCSGEGYVCSISRGNQVAWCCPFSERGDLVSSQVNASKALVPKFAWKYDTRKCVDASPLVALHSMGRHAVIIGSHSHLLVAVDLASGRVLWESELPDRIESSACLTGHGAWICVGCYDGGLYVLSSVSGTVKWCVATEGPVKSSPASVSGSSVVVFGSHDGCLYAADVQTEKVLWKSHLGGGSVFSSPHLDESWHCAMAATLGGSVVCVDMKNGAIAWRVSLGKALFSSPAVLGDRIVVGCVDGLVYCLDWQRKQKIWSFATKGPVFSSASVQLDLPAASLQETGKLVIGSHDHHVYCLSGAGDLLWDFAASSPVYATPFCLSPQSATLADWRRNRGGARERCPRKMTAVELESSTTVIHVADCYDDKDDCASALHCRREKSSSEIVAFPHEGEYCRVDQRNSCPKRQDLPHTAVGVTDALGQVSTDGNHKYSSDSDSPPHSTSGSTLSIQSHPYSRKNCDQEKDVVKKTARGSTSSCSSHRAAFGASQDNTHPHDITMAFKESKHGEHGKPMPVPAGVVPFPRKTELKACGSSQTLPLGSTEAESCSLGVDEEGVVVAACTSGLVYLLAADSGRLLGSVQLPGEVFSSPILVDDLLLVGCRDNHLYCYQLFPEESN